MSWNDEDDEWKMDEWVRERREEKHPHDWGYFELPRRRRTLNRECESV